MNKYAILFSASLVLSACAGPGKQGEGIDVLKLYQRMTQGKSQLQVRTGEPTQFSGSEKICISAQCQNGDKDCKPRDHYNGSPLMANSDFVEYYDLTKGGDGYAHYGNDSQYAKDVDAVQVEMDRLMNAFQSTGLRDALRQQGLTPALMFDIDNTLEFSAGADTDLKGDGPAIHAIVDFANRWCFKDDLVCYFITARDCDANNAEPTYKWLKANLTLNDEQLRHYTHFSRNTQYLTCDVPGSPSIAYKDVIREALEKQEKLFWLMSIGDQLTDALGEHSGMKIRVPNQFFHSDIVPNQYAPWGKGQCGSPNTIAPPRDCAEKLLPRAIEYSSLDYCRRQSASDN